MIKDKLYNYFVRKNGRVWYEYERYVRENLVEHRLHRFRHLRVLIKLNWFYRVKKGNTPYLYWDVPVNADVQIENITSEAEDKKNQIPESEMLKQSKPPHIEDKKNQVSESEMLGRPKPFHMALGLLQYDVISFDIFDTLVFRPFSNPKDLFTIVGKRMNYPTVFTGYKQGRVECEKEARNEREKKYGNREVDIYEIYEQMSVKLGVDRDKGIKTEIETELDYVYPNPYMQIVFNILKTQGKEIVLTSDMYLPKEYIEQILKKCNYDGYKKIYVSCEYRCNKSTGELYKRIKSDYGNKQIVHIGDNVIADIEGAQKVGIETRYYKNINEAGKNKRGEWMAEITGSAYSGLVNAYIHNGLHQYPFFYEYGFIYGGIYIWGFCNWIHNRVREDKIDKLIFLSRDGDIYQKIYNKYFKDVENDYVFWSRFANLKYLIEYNQDAFVDRVIKQKALGTLDVTIKSIFDSFELSFDNLDLLNYGLSLETTLDSSTRNALTKFIRDHWEKIENTYHDERKRVIKEIGEILGETRNVAVIDVGWTASGPLGFKTFVDKYFPGKYEIKCWMAGGAGDYGSGSGIIPYYLDGTIEAYMFSPLHNKRNAQIHTTENVAVTCNAVFELFTQTQYPSFRGRKANGGYDFDIPENENYWIIGQIHKGIADFCNLYYNTFNKDEYLLNIAGFDAYRPFAKLAFNKGFFEDNFVDIINAYGLSGDNLKQCVETIGQRVNHYYKNNGGRK